MKKAILENCSAETLKAIEDLDIGTLEQIVSVCPNTDILLADSLTLIRCAMSKNGNLIIRQVSTDDVEVA